MMRARWRRRARLICFPLAALVLLLAVYTYRSWSVGVEAVQLESRLVGKRLEYNVVLPRGYSFIASRSRYPVLYLLHGWNGHSQDWLAQTKLREYAAQQNLIVVLVEGENGWYTNSATVPTDQYEDYVLRELIPDVDARFRTIRDRNGRGIAGFSMGGYGALKLGLKHTEVFAFAGSTSGALNAARRTDNETIMHIFGPEDSQTRNDNDVFQVVRTLPDDRLQALPFFYMDCGTEDPWLNTNRAMSRILDERKIAHEYREFPGGHDWKYWDTHLPEILRLASQKLSASQ